MTIEKSTSYFEDKSKTWSVLKQTAKHFAVVKREKFAKVKQSNSKAKVATFAVKRLR